jgi:hypothetical protein
MAPPRLLERVPHTPTVALSVVDALARALGLSGEFPPPLGEVRCEAVEALAPAPAPLDPPLRLSTLRSRSGVLLLDGSCARALPGSRSSPLAAGTYRVRVSGELYQDGEFVLAWPPAPGQRRVPLDGNGRPDNVLLLPGPAYPLPDALGQPFQLGPTLLRGTALAPDGTPLGGVGVELLNLQLLQPAGLPPIASWPFLSARSDARGDWALLLPDRRYLDPAPEIPLQGAPPLVKPLTLRLHYPAAAVDLEEPVALGGEHAVRNTALRGCVVGPGGRPLAGVQVTSTAGPAAARSGPDGRWLLVFALDQGDVPNVTVTATAPGGEVTSEPSSVVARSTVVVPNFRFT